MDGDESIVGQLDDECLAQVRAFIQRPAGVRLKPTQRIVLMPMEFLAFDDQLVADLSVNQQSLLYCAAIN